MKFLSFAVLLLALPAFAQESAGPPPVQVRVDAVGSFRPSTESRTPRTGRLEARRTSMLTFAVAGRVAQRMVEEGQSVQQGDPLLRLDAVPFASEVEALESRIRFAEQRLARSEALRAEEAAAIEEVDAQRADLEGLKAQVKQARWALQQATLRAPFDGRVRRIHVERGEMAGPQAPALEFLDPRGLILRVQVPAHELTALDGELSVRTTRSPRVERPGRLHHRPFAGDPRDGSVPVRIEIDDPGPLLPGMVAELVLGPGSMAGLWLPLDALVVEPDRQSVWVVEDGRAWRREVEVGEIRTRWVPVLSGLTGDEAVVRHPPDRLQDGNVVRTGGEGR